jgi:hypothetical protein
MEQQHVIGKFSMEVQLPSRQDAFSLQGRLSDSCNTELAPLLATLLDSWTNPDVLLQIDKLEIDLGSCSQEVLEKDLPRLVIAYLKERYPEIRQEAYLEQGMERIPVGQGYFESWLYFLEHGVLPHAAVKWTRLEWEAGILAILSTETTACWQCEKLLMSKPHALKRLLLQFSRPFVQNWLRAYSAGVCQPLLQLVSEWETFCYHPRLLKIAESIPQQQGFNIPVLPARTDFHLITTEWVIREAMSPGGQKDNARLLEEVMQLLPHTSVKYWLYLLQQMSSVEMAALPLLQQGTLTLAGKYSATLAALKEELAFKPPYIENKAVREDITDPLPEPGKSVSETPALPIAEDQQASVSSSSGESVSSSNEQQTAAADDKVFRLQEDVIKDNISAPEEVVHAADEQPSTVLSDKERDTVNDAGIQLPEEGTVLYINNAGLILLHPYLGIFFDALELREGTGFRDDVTLNKAIQLLGYLACGEDNIPEYDLVFPKLLCGILPAQPIQRFVPLSAAEKAEADELLLSVIAHWNALGSTTPDGLRGNFLMREGKLVWKNGEWQLYVSQQSYDMLLNRLPWGFSVVALSWMPWLIKTVWT